MLRLGDVHKGGDRYYFATVEGATDRPDGLIEADPYWLGRGAEALGLSGRPDHHQVSALLAGSHPLTGEILADRSSGQVTNLAFDLTLSVPKSVSVVHALANEEGSERIARANDAAVAATLGYLEREVLCTRRTAEGETWSVDVEGAVAVGFVHRTSRANDPHLHTHVVIANLGCGTDGRYTAIDSRPLYRAQRHVRALFEGHLRAGLTAAGIELGPMRRDFADIASITRETVLEFSRQTRAIDAALSAEGLRGPAAAAAVADSLRPEKDRSHPYEELRAEWRERGYEVGLSQRRIDEAAGLGVRRARPAPHLSERPWIEQARARGDGTFTQEDLLVARAAATPEGATIDEVERDVGDVLGRGRVVPSGDRLTTPAHQIRLQEASEHLGQLAQSAGAVWLTYGEAGGRVATLDAAAHLARDVEATQHRMVAVAPGNRAARGFEATTGIESFPVKKAGELPAALSLREGDLVILADCAAMTEHELAASLTACRDSGAGAVLLASADSLERTRLLTHAREIAPELSQVPAPIQHQPPGERSFGPDTRALLVPDLSAAIGAASDRAGELEAEGREVWLVAPDRAVATELGAMDPQRAAKAITERIEQDKSIPSLVVVGGAAPLALRAEILKRCERTHVLVSAGDETSLGRAAEAVRPTHLTQALGAVPAGAAGRTAWREGASLIESHREQHAITADASTYGRGSRSPERRRDETVLRRRITEIRPASIDAQQRAHEREGRERDGLALGL